MADSASSEPRTRTLFAKCRRNSLNKNSIHTSDINGLLFRNLTTKKLEIQLHNNNKKREHFRSNLSSIFMTLKQSTSRTQSKNTDNTY